MPRLEVSNEMVGKYVNQVLYSDVNPVGKIIAVRGKSFITIQPVEASENKTKMEVQIGGFAGHTVNNYAQEYDFHEEREPYEVRISNSMLNNRYWRIEDTPRKFYDYNF